MAAAPQVYVVGPIGPARGHDSWGHFPMLANDIFEAPQFRQAEAASTAELVPALEESVRTAREFLTNLDDVRGRLLNIPTLNLWSQRR